MAISAGPVNYQDANGNWQPFDPTVITGPDGRLVRRSAPAGFDAAPASDGSPDLLRASGDGWSIGVQPAGAASGVSGNRVGQAVEYDGLTPGIDMQVAFGNKRADAVLILHHSSSAATWNLDVALSGATLRSDGSGSVDVVSGGATVATITGGIAKDSATAPSATPVQIALVDSATIAVSIDPAWLNDPSRVFPVSVDPTITIGGNNNGQNFDAYAQQNTPTTNYNGAAQWDAGLGHYTNYFGYRSYPTVQDYDYQHFDVSALAGKVILGAQWRNYVWAESAANAPFTIWPTSQSWTASSVIWNGHPQHGPTPRINATAPAAGATVSVGCGSPCPGSGDAMTGLVAGWVSNPSSNFGLDLDTAGVNSVVETEADEDNLATQSPSIYVTYDTPPPASTETSPANASISMSPTPTLTTTPVTDADGDRVSYWFRLATNPDGVSGQVVNSGWLSSSSWTVPAGSLRDGVTYYWQAYTWDSVAGTTSVPAPSRWAFIVNLRLGPQAATPSDTEGPLSVNLANGNVHYETDGPSFNTVGGALQMHYSYNSAAPYPYGLTGKYFANCNPNSAWSTGQPTLVRSDPAVNFNWNSTPPASMIGQTGYCVEWTGYLTVPFAQNNWDIGVYSDDGVRVWVNNSEIINDWVDKTYTEVWSNPQNLPASAVPITIDYYQDTGGAAIDLQESGPVNYGDIPASWLTPGPVDMPQGWTASLGGDTQLSYLSATISSDDLTLTGPEGETTDFTHTNGGSGWTPPPGIDDVISVDSSNNITDFAGDGLVYVFKSTGQLSSVTSAVDDAHPAAPSYSYNASTGQLTGVTDPASGRSFTLRYASDQYDDPNASCKTFPAGFAYPPAGDLCEVDYWDGTATSLYYNTNGQLAEVSDPGGALTDYAYDSSGRLDEVRDPLAADEVTAGLRTNDSTVVTSATYNSSGQASTITLPAPSSPSDPRPQHGYCYGYSQATITSGALGCATTASSSTTSIATAGLAEPHGYSREVTYNSAGQTLTDTDDNGLTTTYTWDGGDNPLAKVEPSGLETTTVYNHIYQGSTTVNNLPTDNYGPAPTTCFSGQTPNGTCTNPAVPHTSTRYDENMYGLQSTYWNNTTLSGSPTAHGLPAICCGGNGVQTNFGYGSPATGVGATNWSSEYSGLITFPTTGSYQFYIYARGGARLFINDNDISDGWAGNPAGINTPAATFSATAGVPYRIKVDYNCSGTCNTSPNTAGMVLQWITPGTGSWVGVPASVLTPGYGLATSSTDADGHVTSADYPNPWLSLSGASITDPGGLKLRTTTSYEAPGTGYGRKVASRLPAETYNAAVLADQPIGYWPLSDPPGASSATDVAGGVGNGTYYSGATTGVAGPLADDPATASSFDGSSGYVATAAASSVNFAATHPYTLEAWVKTTGTGEITVLSKMTSDSLATGYELWLNNGILTAYQISNWTTGNAIEVHGGSAINDGNWHQVAVTSAGTGHAAGLSLFIDGNAVTTTVDMDALSGSITNTVPLDIASRQGIVDFPGQIAQAAVYPAALSASRILTHYQAATGTSSATTDTFYPSSPNTPLTNNCTSTSGVNQGQLLESETDPAGSGGPTIVHQYAYDARGRAAATRVSTDSTWSCTTYDARGRVTQETNSTGAADNTSFATPGTTVETYTDSGGTNRTVTIHFDLLGRNISYTDAFGTITTTAYDQAGRITGTTRQLPGQAATTLTLETYATTGTNADRLTSETEYVSTSPQTLNYTYDGFGRLSSISYPTGVTTTDGYDPNQGYLANIANSSGSTDLETIAYADSPSGKNLTETISGSLTRTRAFTYDQAGRLTQTVQTGGSAPGTRNYSYDSDTNRCSTSTTCNGNYTYDNADRLLTSPYATSYSYNSHGAIYAETPSAGNTVPQAITYDGWDHTTSLDDGTNTVCDVVDPSGRVLQETITNDATHTVTSTTNYGYSDSSDSPSWTQATGATLTTYISTVGGLITDVGGVPTFNLGDRQGSVLATSTSAQLYTLAAEVDEFGRTPTGTQQSLGWLGTHERFSEDAATQTIRMGQRLYDPNVGRFLQADPVPGGSANAYDYCNQDPINCTDLNGEFGWSSIGHFFKKAAHWVVRHRGLIATVLATGACLGAFYICAGASVLAWGIRSQQRGYRHFGANAFDLVTTGISLGGGALFRAAGRAAIRALPLWQRGIVMATRYGYEIPGKLYQLDQRYG